MNVQLFIPCFVDQLYPDTAFNMIKVLEKAGCTVDYNPAQTCCGQPAFNAGFWDEAKPVCSKFIKDFSSSECIVTPSASCAGFVRNYYGKLFENSSVHNEVKDLSKRIFEFSEFMIEILKVEDVGAKLKGIQGFVVGCRNVGDTFHVVKPSMLGTDAWIIEAG